MRKPMMAITALALAFFALPPLGAAQSLPPEPTDRQCAAYVDSLADRGRADRVDAVLDEGNVCSAAFTRSRRDAFALLPPNPTRAQCVAEMSRLWHGGDHSHFDMLAIFTGPCQEAFGQR